MINEMNLHYSFTNPATVHDEDALTALELVGRQGAKINEVIRDQNKLRTETENNLSDQDESIRKMNDVTMPAKVESEVQKQIDNGTFDNAIDRYAGELTDRLDNLLGSVTTGSTTLDAEIIDIRTDARGGVHANAGKAIREFFKNFAYTMNGFVGDENYLEVLPDVNAIDEPCSYQLNFTYGTSNIPANLPYGVFKGSVDELLTFKDKYYRQFLIGDNYLYTRFGVKNESGGANYPNGWKCIYNRDEYENLVKAKGYKSKGLVDSNNYQTVLPDANKILENSTYQLNFIYNSEEITENLPYTKFTGRIDELITFADYYYRQLLISDKYIYIRSGVLNDDHLSVNYGSWVLIWDPTIRERTFIVDKAGSGNYTSLTKCVFENLGTKNTIYVKAGVYDLIQEFKEHFGNDYFDNGKPLYSGVMVQNGSKFFLDSGAEIRFLYDGANPEVESYFSPFFMQGEGGEVHGGRIICSNCRYAIHDDVYGFSDRSKTVIKGVYMQYTSARNVGIGGGVGQSSYITVEDCIIESTSDTVGYGVFYHNTDMGNSQSHIVIRNNYVNHNIVVESYGPSTNISTCIVTNNKCNKVMKIEGGEIDNLLMHSFNNVEET